MKRTGMDKPVATRLPHSVRADLERLFDAKLAAVRVAYAPALSLAGLQAAACGELVLVAEDGPDLTSRDGLSLLGHEIAHCLQQRAWGCSGAAGGAPVFIADPTLEEAADWAASCVRRGEAVPPAVRDVAIGWSVGPETRFARTDCRLAAALREEGMRLPAAHFQARVAGATTYYGGDVPQCPACSQFTVGTAHELASDLLSLRLCRNLGKALRDLSSKSAVERTGSASSAFNRTKFSSLSEAMDASDELSQGYMIGALTTTDGHHYGACSGPAESIPEAFDTAIAMASLLGCRDDLNPDRLRTRGGRRIDPALVYAAPGSNPPGNCAAPKLIQQCYGDGRTPANMVEMFYGKNSPADGQVIESCDTCKSLLPPMLCPSV